MEKPDTVVEKPSNMLVPTTKQETKALVTRAVTSALAGVPQSIGVSRNWLMKHVEQLALQEDEVETLVAVRTELGGLLPHAVKFLYQGLTAQDVYGCYRAQRGLAHMGDKQFSASIKKIAKLSLAFAEADPDNEGFDEMIAEAHRVISEHYFWVQYVDQSITILCAIAEKYGCVTINGALAIVSNHHAKRNGVMPVEDDEMDDYSCDHCY